MPKFINIGQCFTELFKKIKLAQFFWDTVYFRKSHGRTLDKPARQQNLTWNSHSRSFKGMHFEKPTTDCVSLYNNVGLISEVSEEIASDNAENYRCRQPHCRLMPPLQGTPANIGLRIHLILPESRIIGLHFCSWDSMSVVTEIFVVGSDGHMFCAIRVRNSGSRSSKVVDFGTNGKGVCAF